MMVVASSMQRKQKVQIPRSRGMIIGKVEVKVEVEDRVDVREKKVRVDDEAFEGLQTQPRYGK